MSQEPPNSQPPSPEPELGNSDSSRRVSENAQIQASSSGVLKTQSIKILRGTIRLLEGVVTKLETEPPPGTTTTQQSWWSTVLGKIRSVLPANLSSQLSDTALSGIIAAIAVIIVWTTSSLLSGKPLEVATIPSPVAETPLEVVTAPPISEIPKEVATAPVSEPEPTPIPTPVEEPPTTIPTPPELSAPAAAEPVEETLPEPKPTSTPIVELTPEQTLIAAIEKQVAEISNSIADGLIDSIQVNFEASSLTAKVRNDWYTLKPSEQDKLAAQMLKRSRELDFNRLEITDPKGTLLARSPVVGKDMIIFKRG